MGIHTYPVAVVLGEGGGISRLVTGDYDCQFFRSICSIDAYVIEIQTLARDSLLIFPLRRFMRVHGSTLFPQISPSEAT